jgi:hypothetical protein
MQCNLTIKTCIYHGLTNTHTADTILDIAKTRLYDLIISIICSGQFRVRHFGRHPALTLKSCWYFVGVCKDVVYSHRRQIQRSFITYAQSLKMLAQLFWSGNLKLSTCVYNVLVMCTVDISSTFWNTLKWSDVKWIEVKWSEVKWSEVEWSEVSNGEP